MRRNKGFTLIEVMVVLSILAIIAILAYNFFGSTMKEAKDSQAATKLYNDMRTIADGLDLYVNKNGAYPPDRGDESLLVSTGILKSLPTLVKLPGAPVNDDYEWFPAYDNMDGIGANDDTLTTYTNMTLDVCAEFNRRYAAPPLNDGTVFDYEAAGNQYPGQALGRQHKVYAIKWSTAATKCEIDWVMQYND